VELPLDASIGMEAKTGATSASWRIFPRKSGSCIRTARPARWGRR
jgi:hypothetical protein